MSVFMEIRENKENTLYLLIKCLCNVCFDIGGVHGVLYLWESGSIMLVEAQLGSDLWVTVVQSFRKNFC